MGIVVSSSIIYLFSWSFYIRCMYIFTTRESSSRRTYRRKFCSVFFLLQVRLRVRQTYIRLLCVYIDASQTQARRTLDGPLDATIAFLSWLIDATQTQRRRNVDAMQTQHRRISEAKPAQARRTLDATQTQPRRNLDAPQTHPKQQKLSIDAPQTHFSLLNEYIDAPQTHPDTRS